MLPIQVDINLRLILVIQVLNPKLGITLHVTRNVIPCLGFKTCMTNISLKFLLFQVDIDLEVSIFLI